MGLFKGSVRTRGTEVGKDLAEDGMRMIWLRKVEKLTKGMNNWTLSVRQNFPVSTPQTPKIMSTREESMENSKMIFLKILVPPYG